MVRKINCIFYTRKAPGFAKLNVSTIPNGGPLIRYLPLKFETGQVLVNGFRYSTVEMDVHWLMGQGRHPYINLWLPEFDNVEMECTISGELVDPIAS